MGRAGIRALLMGLVLALALGACAAGGDVDGVEPTTAEPVGLTLTAPGVSADRVTDVAARALTEEQLDELIELCQDNSGVPDINVDCLSQSPQIDFLPPCELRTQICVIWGSVEDSDVGVVQVRDDRPESSLCGGRAVDICTGVVVPSGVVAELSATSSDTSTSELTTTPTTPTDTSTSTPSATTEAETSPPTSASGSGS